MCDIISCIHSLPPKSKNLKNFFSRCIYEWKTSSVFTWVASLTLLQYGRWETLGSIILPKRYKWSKVSWSRNPVQTKWISNVWVLQNAFQTNCEKLLLLPCFRKLFFKGFLLLNVSLQQILFDRWKTYKFTACTLSLNDDSSDHFFSHGIIFAYVSVIL